MNTKHTFLEYTCNCTKDDIDSNHGIYKYDSNDTIRELNFTYNVHQIKNLEQLKDLEILRLRIYSNMVGNISNLPQNLKELHIEFCDYIDFRTELLQLNEGLEVLSINFMNIYYDDISKLKLPTTIRKLTIKGIESNTNEYQRFFNYLAKRCKKLEVIKYKVNKVINFNLKRLVIKNLHNLHTLKLSRVNNNILIKDLSKLERLKLKGIRDIELSCLNSLDKLELNYKNKLNIISTDELKITKLQITNYTKRDSCTYDPMLFKNVKEVRLKGNNDYECMYRNILKHINRLTKLTIDIFKSIKLNTYDFLNLKELYIKNIRVPDSSNRQIFKVGKIPELKVLHILAGYKVDIKYIHFSDTYEEVRELVIDENFKHEFDVEDTFPNL